MPVPVIIFEAGRAEYSGGGLILKLSWQAPEPQIYEASKSQVTERRQALAPMPMSGSSDISCFTKLPIDTASPRRLCTSHDKDPYYLLTGQSLDKYGKFLSGSTYSHAIPSPSLTPMTTWLTTSLNPGNVAKRN